MKKCTVCKEIKDFSNFYKSISDKDGYGYRCKICDKIARKKSRHRLKPKEENKTYLGYKRRWLFFKYGLRVNEYEEMLEKQNYSCAICKTKNPAGEGINTGRLLSFAVDHNHTTGKNRGLLCNLCNRGIGFLKDSEEILQAAVDYLKYHNSTCH